MTAQPRNQLTISQDAEQSPLNMVSDPGSFSPLVAEQWATLIIQHWHTCQIAGEINTDAPLDILDFMPGRGHAIWLLVRALFARMGSTRKCGLRFRYLPVAAKRECFENLRSRHELSTWLADKTLVPLLWGRKGNRACLLLPNGRQTWCANNPVVMLTHDLWARLPQRLFAVHYGKLFEADLAMLELEKHADSQPNFWKKLEGHEWHPGIAPLIDEYLIQLNSSPLPYPEAVLNMLDGMTSLPGCPSIVLSTARGYTCEHKMRMSQFSEFIAALRSSSREPIPINFHLLAHKIRQLNGVVGQIDLQKGAVLQIALHGHLHAEARLTALLDSVDTAMFQKVPALIEAMRALGPGADLDCRLALIKLSSYDADVFCAGYADLMTAFARNTDFDRESWRNALERIWDNYLIQSSSHSLHRKIAPAAMHCGHWGLARTILMWGLKNIGENACDLAHLAWCEARTGYLQHAHQIANKALALDPALPLAVEVASRVETRLATWNQAWRIAVQDDTLPLVIEPLDLSHAEALLYQYRDPQIAVMVGLPALTTIEKVREWILEQDTERGRVNFAVMHADHGFVGYINLAISAHASYFCFWTGVDFQGYGIATAAGRLVCDLAKKQGISVMLTAAYADNARSIRALRRLGFVEIPIRALPPDHDRIFFYLPEQSAEPAQSIVAELIDYYARENLPLYFPLANQTLPISPGNLTTNVGIDFPA